MNQTLTPAMLESERSIWNRVARQALDEDTTVTDQPLPTLEEWGRSKYHYRYVLEELEEVTDKSTPVLQLGAGDGMHLLLGRAGFNNVTVADLADVALQLAESRAVRAGLKGQQYVHLDAHQMPFPAQKFGLVFASGVLHHLNRKIFIPELHRVCAPDAKCIFIDPMFDGFLRLFLKLRRFRSVDRGSDWPIESRDMDLAKDFFQEVVVGKFGTAQLLFRMLPFLKKLPRQRFLELSNALARYDFALSSRFPSIGNQAMVYGVIRLRSPRHVSPA